MRRTRLVVNLKQCDGDLGLQPTSEVSRKDNHNKDTVGMPTWALKSKYGIWTQHTSDTNVWAGTVVAKAV